MKRVTTLLKRISILAMGIALFASCVKETQYGDTPTPDGGNKEVSFVIQSPAHTAANTRATVTQEDKIGTIHILGFHNGGDNDGTLAFTRSVTVPDTETAATKTFSAKLPLGDYKLLFVTDTTLPTVAAADATAGTNDWKLNSTTIAQATTALTASITDNGWPVATTPIPMFGQTTKNITSEVSTIGSAQSPIELKRMVARINVFLKDEVNTTPAFDVTEDFTLEYVRFYNVRPRGQVITNAAGDVSIPTGTGTDRVTGTGTDAYYTYTQNSSLANMEREIYVFEDEGIIEYGTDGWVENPCIVIGGSYDGGGTTWYRLDFINASTWLQNIKRNHSYNFIITSVKGEGYGSPEQALESRPINMEAKVIEWDDEDMADGVWNGSNSILFSGRRVDFTQFGVAKASTTNTISILTDVPDLTFGNFANNAAYLESNDETTRPEGDRDAAWSETSEGSGVWTNKHFTATITSAKESDDKMRYTIVFTARATVTGESSYSRESTFTASGGNLSVTFTINQDAHVEYRLLTDPDPAAPVVRDGSISRFPIVVTSTHDFDLEILSNNTMFNGVYDTKDVGTGTAYTMIDSKITGIDNGTGTVTLYVELGQHDDGTPRVGSFSLYHNAADVEAVGGSGAVSTAGARIFNVLQVTPVITAELQTAPIYAGTIAKTGGSVKIDVKSNMSEWVPTLFVDDVQETDEDRLKAYFNNLLVGNGDMEVTFTAGALADDATSDRVFKIYFGDAATTTAANTITITQKNGFGNGGGGEPQNTGTLALEGFLAVDINGVLNLDGQNPVINGNPRTKNYLVHFQYGTSVAVGGEGTFSASKVAWVPEGYDYEALMTKMGSSKGATAWAYMPANTSSKIWVQTSTTAYHKLTGLGNPCIHAVKDGETVQNMIPASVTNDKWLGTTEYPATANSFGTRVFTFKSIQYPYVGRWNETGTWTSSTNIWSANKGVATASVAYGLRHAQNADGGNYASGLSQFSTGLVRCVQN